MFLNHYVSRDGSSLVLRWPTLVGPVDGASLYRWTTDGHMETMEKVQNLKNSNTAPSPKTFRDELNVSCGISSTPDISVIFKLRTEKAVEFPSSFIDFYSPVLDLRLLLFFGTLIYFDIW
jgi:hypothetical protein